MNDLVDRLSLGAAQARTLNREPTAKILIEAAEAVGAAEARIAELTEALRDFIDLSDSRKSRELAEIKRILAKARAALASPVAVPVARKVSDEEVTKALYAQYSSIMRS